MLESSGRVAPWMLRGWSQNCGSTWPPRRYGGPSAAPSSRSTRGSIMGYGRAGSTPTSSSDYTNRKRAMRIHGNRKWTDEKLAPLVEMRRSGKTQQQIGAAIGCTRARVGQLIGKLKFCRSCKAEMPGEAGRTCLACKNLLRAKPCRGCGKSFVPTHGEPSLFCPKCRWETRPCRCGCNRVITRPRRAYSHNRRRWFHSFGAWNRWKAKVGYDWREDKKAA